MKVNIGCHIPIEVTRLGIGRHVNWVYLLASRRISSMLFKKAQNEAKGNADEKSATKPNFLNWPKRNTIHVDLRYVFFCT